VDAAVADSPDASRATSCSFCCRSCSRARTNASSLRNVLGLGMSAANAAAIGSDCSGNSAATAISAVGSSPEAPASRREFASSNPMSRRDCEELSSNRALGSEGKDGIGSKRDPDAHPIIAAAMIRAIHSAIRVLFLVLIVWCKRDEEELGDERIIDLVLKGRNSCNSLCSTEQRKGKTPLCRRLRATTVLLSMERRASYTTELPHD
jgi:hypothetical protein